MEREFKALIKSGEKLKCNKFILVTYDYKGYETKNGYHIEIMPYYEFDLIKNLIFQL